MEDEENYMLTPREYEEKKKREKEEEEKASNA